VPLTTSVKFQPKPAPICWN